MMLLVILILTFLAAGLLVYFASPFFSERFMRFQKKRSKALADKMDEMFIRAKLGKIVLIYTLGPVVFATVGYALVPIDYKLIGLLAGVGLGIVGPNIVVKILAERRKETFKDQLVDSLMIMSSSLKGGLSIIQAIEVVTEEMPAPISQEFGILLGENKMGVALEEAFNHLYQRVPSTPLHQMITAILLARETGGNLPAIFSRIVTTIRENKKIKQNLDNLTLQGKIQGAVMTLLPVGFGFFILSTNKNFFDSMLQSDMGRTLLTYAVVSEVIGAFLIWKISSFKEF